MVFTVADEQELQFQLSDEVKVETKLIPVKPPFVYHTFLAKPTSSLSSPQPHGDIQMLSGPNGTHHRDICYLGH